MGAYLARRIHIVVLSSYPTVMSFELADDLTTLGGAGLALPGLLIGGTLQTHNIVIGTHTHTHTRTKIILSLLHCQLSLVPRLHPLLHVKNGRQRKAGWSLGDVAIVN